MNRRDSLWIITGALWAAGLVRASAQEAVPADAAAGTADAATGPEGGTAGTLDARLKRDVERLAPRVYSDEGIPVLLACVDLTRKGGPAPALTPLNAELAAQIRDNAAAWERLYPQAKPEDVSKLIEVLAERDFTAQPARVGR